MDSWTKVCCILQLYLGCAKGFMNSSSKSTCAYFDCFVLCGSKDVAPSSIVLSSLIQHNPNDLTIAKKNLSQVIERMHSKLIET
jgi:hypothetical protein